MSLETYLKRTVKPNDLPYVKQAIKEWLTQKRQEIESSLHFPSELKIIDELLDSLEFSTEEETEK